MLKRLFPIALTIIVLTGCSLQETIEQGKAAIEKGEKVAADLNKVTAVLDRNIREIQNTKVFEEDFTFKELIDATTENPVWKNESGDYVTVQAKITASVVEYESLEEILLGFPYSEEGIPLANAGVFTTIDGAIKVKGQGYEISGDEVIHILFEIYKNN